MHVYKKYKTRVGDRRRVNRVFGSLVMYRSVVGAWLGQKANKFGVWLGHRAWLGQGWGAVEAR